MEKQDLINVGVALAKVIESKAYSEIALLDAGMSVGEVCELEKCIVNDVEHQFRSARLSRLNKALRDDESETREEPEVVSIKEILAEYRNRREPVMPGDQFKYCIPESN